MSAVRITAAAPTYPTNHSGLALQTYSQLVVTLLTLIASSGKWRESCDGPDAPAVWGKEPMVVVGKSTVWIWVLRRTLNSSLRLNMASFSCSLGSSAHRSTVS